MKLNYSDLEGESTTVPIAAVSGHGTQFRLVANLVYTSNVLTYTVIANGEARHEFDNVKDAYAKFAELVDTSRVLQN